MSYVGTNGGNTRLAQALPNWKYAFASQIGLHTTEFPVGHRLTALWQFINTRTTHGSYHAGADSHGSNGQYCPWSWGAWHAPSINRHSAGVAGNCRADEWDRMSSTARNNLINGMARQAHRYSRWQVANGRPAVPARKLTKRQAENRERGFVYHGALQADRSDPTGPRDVFPWSQFLTEYRRLESGDTILEGEVMTSAYDVWAYQNKDVDPRQVYSMLRNVESDILYNRDYDYANPDGDPTSVRHQISRAHQYSMNAAALNDRRLDYVNEENPSTARHQIARAHQYSMNASTRAREARNEASETKAMVKALASTLDELLKGQGKILKAVEEAETRVVKANAAEVAAELEITTKEDD